MAQFEAFIGFYDDAAGYFGYVGFVVLEPAERVHSAVADQHIFFIFCLLKFYCCGICHFNCLSFSHPASTSYAEAS
jgi:hypothetical protein